MTPRPVAPDRHKHALESLEQRLQTSGFDSTKVQLEFERMQRSYSALEGSLKQQLTQVQATVQGDAQQLAELGERLRVSEQRRAQMGSQVDQVCPPTRPPACPSVRLSVSPPAIDCAGGGLIPSNE